MRREIDLVEEVARFRLEDVPPTLPVRQEMFGRLTHEQRLRRQVEDVLVGAGLYEAYTYSLQADDPDPNAIELPVPLVSQQRVLRTTLAVGLLGAARHNVDMGQQRRRAVRGRARLPAAPGTVPDERWRLGGIVQGDFFRAKGDRRGGLRGAARRAALRARAAVRGGDRRRDACSRAGSRSTGRSTSTASGARSSSTSRELFAAVPERILYRDVITYPPLRLDLAFVVDEGVPAGDLIAAAREAAGEELREVRFLSDYRGDQIPAGKKSVAFAVAFQSPERTLSDEDGERLRGAIVDALARDFGATLRA